MHRSKGVEQCVADTRVPEKHLLTPGDLPARIGAECGQPEDDERLFQDVQVTIHRRPGDLELRGQFIDRDFRAGLVR